MVLYSIPSRDVARMARYPGFLRYSDRGVWLRPMVLYSIHPGMFLGWRVLPGILKILGQGGMAVSYGAVQHTCTSRDVPRMARVTRDSQVTRTGGYGCVLWYCTVYIPGRS